MTDFKTTKGSVNVCHSQKLMGRLTIYTLIYSSLKYIIIKNNFMYLVL